MRRLKRGFTIIELLVVVAIMSLLVSILLPSLRKAKELARQIACAAQQRSVGLAMQTYAAESSGWLPYARETGGGGSSWTRTWAHQLVDGGLLGKGPAVAGYDRFFTDVTTGVFQCPSRPPPANPISDVLQHKPTGYLLGNRPRLSTDTTGTFRRMTNVAEPAMASAFYLLAEGARGRANWNPTIDLPDRPDAGWGMPHGEALRPLLNLNYLDGHSGIVYYNAPRPPNSVSRTMGLFDPSGRPPRTAHQRSDLGLTQNW